MGLRIITNVNSIKGQRTLGLVTKALNEAMEHISSGYRINKAADDAAGLAISEKLKAQVRGMAQARRNAYDGVSLVQTAEGGLNEISNILIRLRELSVQAASDTIGPSERSFLQKEFTSLRDEVDRIALSADYNGTRLLTGETELPPSLAEQSNKSPLEFQIGASYMESVDGMHVGNPVNIIRLDLRDLNAMTGGEGSLNLRSLESEEEDVRIDTKHSAQKALSRLDEALTQVASYRAKLGAIQNRLGSTTNNLSIAIENLSEARSRIRDADYAAETAEVTKQRILQQSGIAVLAQANQQPELALRLLQSQG